MAKDNLYTAYFKGVDVDIFPINYKNLVKNEEFRKYLIKIYRDSSYSKIDENLKLIEKILEKSVQKDGYIYLFGYCVDVTKYNNIVECKTIEEFLNTATIINVLSPDSIINLGSGNCMIDTKTDTIVKNTRFIYFKNASWAGFGLNIDFEENVIPTLNTNVIQRERLRGFNVFSTKKIIWF